MWSLSVPPANFPRLHPGMLTVLVATSGDIFSCQHRGMVLLACGSGWRPGSLLHTLQSPGQPPQQRATQPKCPLCHRGDSTAHGVSCDLLSQNVSRSNGISGASVETLGNIPRGILDTLRDHDDAHVILWPDHKRASGAA